MTISEIKSFPTSVKEIPAGCVGVHESVLKAYQILQKAKGLLSRNVPPEVVLELIAEMEESPE